jgi:hypothetical protein
MSEFVKNIKALLDKAVPAGEEATALLGAVQNKPHLYYAATSGIKDKAVYRGYGNALFPVAGSNPPRAVLCYVHTHAALAIYDKGQVTLILEYSRLSEWGFHDKSFYLRVKTSSREGKILTVENFHENGHARFEQPQFIQLQERIPEPEESRPEYEELAEVRKAVAKVQAEFESWKGSIAKAALDERNKLARIQAFKEIAEAAPGKMAKLEKKAKRIDGQLLTGASGPNRTALLAAESERLNLAIIKVDEAAEHAGEMMDTLDKELAELRAKRFEVPDSLKALLK